MIAILRPDCSFANVQTRLNANGWKKVESPGLRPPLRPGEPETAVFENGADGTKLSYSFNPALDLRAIEGDALPPETVLGRVASDTIESWLKDRDPRSSLRGLNAAAMLGLTALSDVVAQAVQKLPPDLRQYGRIAEQQIASPAIKKPDTVRDLALITFSALPLLMRRAVLRQTLVEDPKAARTLLRLALGDSDAELAAIAAVGAARLGSDSLAQEVARASLAMEGVDRRTRARFNAVKQVALEILHGDNTSPVDQGKLAFREALLGELDDGKDSAFFAALMDPDPEIGPTSEIESAGLVFHRIEPIPHWLGHEEEAPKSKAGAPLHKWQPRRAYSVSVTASSELISFEEAQDRLSDTSAELGHDLRLPTCEEWEAAMRGPQGCPRPWGLGARPAPGFLTGPWGLAGSGNGGEWTTLDGEGVAMGCDPYRHLALRKPQATTSRARLRPVFDLHE